MPNLVAGLLAHVDAGKTTLSEALLVVSGALRQAGRVDHGDAFLDTDTQEKERGITIFSKMARLTWKSQPITLLDTPGHVDFSGETERALSVMDAAILVISGSDGVQSHTETLWRLLRAYRVPTVIFVNKMDQPGADREHLTQELKSRLSENCVDLQRPDAGEEIALCDEAAMETYLKTGAVPDDMIARLVAERKLFPCCFGSALKITGVEHLLDTLVRTITPPAYPADFAAKVYKISRDPQGARLTFLKVTGGSLKVKDTLNDEKINQIRLYHGARYTLADEAPAGALCAVTGLNTTRAGDALGAETQTPAPMLSPVFSCQVILPEGADPSAALKNLRQIEEEDPLLHIVWNAEKREIHAQMMGEVQMEILQRLAKDRFDLDISFGEGAVLYRETIAAPVIGIGHYEPLRHYAEVHLRLEPGEPGSGLRFASECREDDLDRNWQRLILTHLMEKEHRGVLTGSPVTDMKITLIAGRAHLKHTEGGDFRQATYRAVRQGLMSADSVLLEPWMDVRLTLPSDCLGRAMNDLTLMGGKTDAPEISGDLVILTGSAPAAALRGYAREVTSYTRGKGRLDCVPRGYAPCREAEKVIAEIGYDPERDTDNPADSVFCAHGAGYTVSWRQVPAFAHLHPDTGLPQSAPSAPTRTAYRGTEDEEKELKAIFERTYGKPKPRSADVAPDSSRPVVNGQAVEIPSGPEYLIVDGYNIIFAWPDLKKLAADNLADARARLIDRLGNYRGARPCEMTVVFDAYRVPGHRAAEETIHNIRVIYTQEGETADNFIEKEIRRLSREHKNTRLRARVATSDGLEQVMIFGGGAMRVSATEFLREVEQTEREIADLLERNNLEPAPRPKREPDSSLAQGDQSVVL